MLKEGKGRDDDIAQNRAFWSKERDYENRIKCRISGDEKYSKWYEKSSLFPLFCIKGIKVSSYLPLNIPV